MNATARSILHDRNYKKKFPIDQSAFLVDRMDGSEEVEIGRKQQPTNKTQDHIREAEGRN